MAAPGKCKNIAMQQHIELNRSISVFFNPQQLRKPVVGYFLTFAFASKAERALSFMQAVESSYIYGFLWKFIVFHGLGVSSLSLPNTDS